MDEKDKTVPELTFTSSDIIKAVKVRLETFKAKQLTKNAELVERLKNLKEEDISTELLHAEVCIGYLEINCTAEGFRRYDDGSYVRRTMNDVVSSTHHVFLVSGNEQPAMIAENHYGYSSYQTSAFTLQSYGELSAANVAKKVAENYCSQQLSALNMNMQSCRVNDYRFVPTSEHFDYYSWKIFTTVADKKGETTNFRLGWITPKDMLQKEQNLELDFTLKTPKNERSTKRNNLILHILHTLLLIASLAGSAFIYYSNDGGLYNLLPTLAPSLIAFALSKLIHKRGLRIFFTVISLGLIIATAAMAVAYLLA